MQCHTADVTTWCMAKVTFPEMGLGILHKTYFFHMQGYIGWGTIAIKVQNCTQFEIHYNFGPVFN